MKRINQILFSSIILIILLVGLIFYQMKTYKLENPGCAIPDHPKDFCGNSNLTENGEKGKEIFNSNCAACHKLDAKSTGPALRNIDSLVFVKWMLIKNYKIDSTKIENLGIDYHRIMFKDVLNQENLTFLIDYCSETQY